MRHHGLQHGLRLNRSVGVSCLFFQIVSAFFVDSLLWGILLGLSVVLTLGAMLFNELSLRMSKRLAKIDPLMIEKMALALPIMTGLVIIANYGLTGQIGILLLGIVAMLQGFLVGHRWLAVTTMAVVGVVYMALLPVNYPRSLGFFTMSGTGLVLTLLPLIVTLYRFGDIAGGVLRSSTDKVEKLQSLAAIDELTGLINRRQFNKQLTGEMSRATRNGSALSLALFDIDDFKKINDVYGHPMGDRVLKELGELIIKNLRDSDIPARYGGEEFALILPDTRQIEAYDILERLRQLVEETVFCLPDNPMTMTISIGLAHMDAKNLSPYELIEKADAALYEAKNRGKNQVVFGVMPTPKPSLDKPFFERQPG